MFLDTMSPEAIIKEARRDTTAIQNKRDFFINTHRREILFAKKFPVSYRIEWKSPLTYNKWHIIITCNNKRTGKPGRSLLLHLRNPLWHGHYISSLQHKNRRTRFQQVHGTLFQPLPHTSFNSQQSPYPRDGCNPILRGPQQQLF